MWLWWYYELWISYRIKQHQLLYHCSSLLQKSASKMTTLVCVCFNMNAHIPCMYSDYFPSPSIWLPICASLRVRLISPSPFTFDIQLAFSILSIGVSIFSDACRGMLLLFVNSYRVCKYWLHKKKYFSLNTLSKIYCI